VCVCVGGDGCLLESVFWLMGVIWSGMVEGVGFEKGFIERRRDREVCVLRGFVFLLFWIGIGIF